MIIKPEEIKKGVSQRTVEREGDFMMREVWRP
jgi:hypothetical protein